MIIIAITLLFVLTACTETGVLPLARDERPMFRLTLPDECFINTHCQDLRSRNETVGINLTLANGTITVNA